MEIVAVDLGGTNARFALAWIDAGQVTAVEEPVTLKTADYPGFEAAWVAFGERIGRPLPPALGMAFAGPVGRPVLTMTNTPWKITPADLPGELGLTALTIVNDFAAVGHAIGHLEPHLLRHVCGPEQALPNDGAISIVGPGTGLGVGLVVRRAGVAEVLATEGGHVGFAPQDETEVALLAALTRQFGHVSAERVVSGPGLAHIHDVLAEAAGAPAWSHGDTALWMAALAGEGELPKAALAAFCRALGSVAGDMALAHGAVGVALAGGVGLRLADHLAGSGFAERFCAKGRFETLMQRLPVKLVTHPQAGLLGAAAAFAAEHA
jgi:glucokinase